MVAAPLYTVTCVALNTQQTEGVEAVQLAIQAIERTICQYNGGKYSVQKQVNQRRSFYSIMGGRDYDRDRQGGRGRLGGGRGGGGRRGRE